MPAINRIPKVEHDGERFSTLVGTLRISQSDLATKAEVSQAYVSSIVSGRAVLAGRKLAAFYSAVDDLIVERHQEGYVTDEIAEEWQEYLRNLRAKAGMPEKVSVLQPATQALGFLQRYIDWDSIYQAQKGQLDEIYSWSSPESRMLILGDLEKILKTYELPARNNAE